MKKLFSVLLALSMLLVGAMAMAESETVMIQSLTSNLHPGLNTLLIAPNMNSRKH